MPPQLLVFGSSQKVPRMGKSSEICAAVFALGLSTILIGEQNCFDSATETESGTGPVTVRAVILKNLNLRGRWAYELGTEGIALRWKGLSMVGGAIL